MASVNPLPAAADGVDDDEFDWEAAVREIDVACEKASTSASIFDRSLPENRNWNGAAGSSNCSASFVNNGRRPTGNCKQSTLDSFVGRQVTTPGICKQSTLDGFVGRQGTKKWVVEDTKDVSVGNDRAGVAGEGGSCVEIDPEAAKTWIYPVNIPLREYQLAITKTALFSNTLVALPTGLGKTLIAAVVMYNYFRWFPKGKIVFAAPSRPLVIQQIEACHNIMGIPQEWTIDLTGQICPTKRASFWKSKRVFFVTPQVFEKDIQAGTCSVRSLVCLVIDEAHRASGNYAYCVAVRELMAVPVELRILALSATPGSNQQTVQQIIDNLQISTLEYRNESDPDVSPYVHNRKIELIEVPMGKDAVDLNKLLLDVARPYVSKLSAFGLLPNRDFQTLSPPDFLNSRGEFRRAPPPNLPQSKGAEIEAYFGGLITLYHIRKLLSSHGIRPAYEMLDEKLKQGHFAKLMSRNEGIRKAKLIMEQSLTHGAPNPKLSKMLEVLLDHFKNKNSQNSRVIIFSNFRGSVRDIMNSLASIGDLVKATEFIGQSSGKSLKGQSQKVQQAVLQKFRAGGYNVIVATSIGEEGLDIMEVDLVICFDANVSPLRMIQRMGRTGRKHDGRVVVLACEGSEMKSYMRKQANGRHIKKHMHNGGTNSFRFHPSSRMIPHIFKPEVQYVEMSIEQYVPRGKKANNDCDIRTPTFTKKLTATESAVIAKYFQNATWSPSLIAFPTVQSYPSRVHRVMHSSRTEMLIDAMQNLQALPFLPADSRSFSPKGETFSGKCLGIDNTDNEDHDREDFGGGYNSWENNWDNNQSDSEGSMEHNWATKSPRVLDLTSKGHPTHSFLFGSDFVVVDSLGTVLISYVPSFPLKVASNLKTSDVGSNRPTTVENICTELTELCEPRCKINRRVNDLPLVDSVIEERDVKSEGDCLGDSYAYTGFNAPSPKVDEYCNEYKDAELSPRLAKMMQSGIVPESPVNDNELLHDRETEEFLVPRTPSPPRDESNAASVIGEANMADLAINDRIQTPSPETTAIKISKIVSSISPALNESNSPLTNICSRDWLLSSSDKSDSVKPVRRLKRLRKVGERANKNPGSMKPGPFVHEMDLNGYVDANTSRNQSRHQRSKRKQLGDVKEFIEEEADVSSNGEVSEDEKVDEDDSSYEPSFIDDRMNPTQPSRVDMMAVYRRSLLSQSPMQRESPSGAVSTPNTGSSSANVSSLHDSMNRSTDHDRKSSGENHERGRSSSSAVPCSTRKLSFHGSGGGSVPIINLEAEFAAEARNNENAAAAADDDIDEDMFYDDQFFATIDALEAQASSIHQQGNNTTDMSVHHKPNMTMPPPSSLSALDDDSDMDGLPTFDLGI